MSALAHILPAGRPLLALAPMQDVTDLPFWRISAHYGPPDLLYTEYFRVHRDSKPERHILSSIIENPTGRPVQAQMIGQDIPSLCRTAEALQKQNILGIDLNLGCPAPIVCRKTSGGGLLREPEQIEAILRALRPTVRGVFTVKSRIGYDRPEEFDALLSLYAQHPIDALTIHGRTVREMYRPHVHYNRIATAVRAMSCPVFANGNVFTAQDAVRIAQETGAAGLMIGRGAIRNPWLFTQCRELFTTGAVQTQPTLRDVREYIERLWTETSSPDFRETPHVAKMKKYLNYIAPGIPTPEHVLAEESAALDGTESQAHASQALPLTAPGSSAEIKGTQADSVEAIPSFLFRVRRAATASELFAICDRFLDVDTPFDSTWPQTAAHCERAEKALLF